MSVTAVDASTTGLKRRAAGLKGASAAFVLLSLLCAAPLAAAQGTAPPALDEQAQDAFATMLERLRIFRESVTLQAADYNVQTGAHCFRFTTPNPYSGRAEQRAVGVHPDGAVVVGSALCFPNRMPAASVPTEPPPNWPTPAAAVAECSDANRTLPEAPPDDPNEYRPPTEMPVARSGEAGGLRWRVCRGTVAGPTVMPFRHSVIVFFDPDSAKPVLSRGVGEGTIGTPFESGGNIVVPVTGGGNGLMDEGFAVFRQAGRWQTSDYAQAVGRAVALASPGAWKVYSDLRTMRFNAQLYLPGEAHCCPTGGAVAGRLLWRGGEVAPLDMVVSRIGSPAQRLELQSGRWRPVPLGDEWTFERHIVACWSRRGGAARWVALALRPEVAADGRVTRLEVDEEQQPAQRLSATLVDGGAARQLRQEQEALAFLRDILSRCPVPGEQAAVVSGRVHVFSPFRYALP